MERSKNTKFTRKNTESLLRDIPFMQKCTPGILQELIWVRRCVIPLN